MSRRLGSANNGLLVAVVSLVAVAGLIFLLSSGGDAPTEVQPAGNGTDNPKPDAPVQPTDSTSTKKLVMYCAAGIKLPVEAAAKAYEEEFGVEIQLQYGGSGTLLNNLQIAETGDLYLAADTSYIEIARQKKLLHEAVPVGRLRPVIAIHKDNDKGIKGLDDLLKPEVNFGLANPDAASVGKATKKILTKMGKWEEISTACKVFKPTVNELTSAVKLKSVDAAVIWDSQVNLHSDELTMIHVPEFDAATKQVTVGVLKWCKESVAALRFCRFMSAPSKGQQYFTQFGIENIGGDEWSESPELVLYSGGVNRLAIEDTVKAFKQREGVSVKTIYNGCGILVAMIKGNENQPPDAYFACDASFMDDVQSDFRPPLTISDTDMVVIVQKGNPMRVKDVKELTKADLKVGVANAEQSALGELTKKLFLQIKLDDSNLYEAVQGNVRVQTPTADMLVNQVLANGLDAAIVYKANVASISEKLEIIPIRTGNPKAVQPIAVNKASKHPYLAQRLVEAITSAESRERFLSHGFGWRVPLPSAN
ncbi:MAG: hypothetical protein CMJ78_15485 [Planctomycetaceae bacterium]|nr:hypothetical protein [Planctomycetaceae bacterium]